MSYGIDSIKELTTLEGFRTRPQMYLGSADLEGAYQSLKEIINNATDESQNGYGDKIILSFVPSKNQVTVTDFGRGVPFGIREDGENVLVSIYTKLHVGGKFDHKAYKNSGGLNGAGGSASCATSSYFKVVSVKDGIKATAEFKEGVNTFYDEESTKDPNGTSVTLVPDPKVFNIGEINYSYDRICKEIENTSYFNRKVKFIVVNEDTKEKNEYYSENGIVDFLTKNISKPLMNPVIAEAADDTDEVEIAFAWTGDKEASYVFVNGLYCPEGGSPITGAKTTITTQVKRMSGADLTGDLTRKGLVYVINCRVSEPSFANQTKTKINNPNLRTLASSAFKKGLEDFAMTAESEQIISMLKKFQKAEKAAERARKQILETSKEIEKNASKKVFNTDKLKDAEFLGKDSTLLLVEGDSAAGAIAKARDYKNYGILALRGKILNCLSNSDEKIAENEEIKLFLKATGIIPGKYNSSKLRYGRVGICVDGDSDGGHIALLIMALLRFIAPKFLEEGRLCWLKTPLYIVKQGKEEKYFFTDEEFNAVRGTIKGDVQRNKGLGSLSAEQARKSMFTDEYQRMEIIKPDAASLTLLEDLMGEDVTPRTKYIFENIDFSVIRE